MRDLGYSEKVIEKEEKQFKRKYEKDIIKTNEFR